MSHVRSRGAKRAFNALLGLIPTHREPVRQYCYLCQAPRVFNARDNCVSCGQRRGSGRSFGW